MLAQKLLRILSALSNLVSLISKPGSALINQLLLYTKVQNLSLFRNPRTEADIKLHLLKRRRNLVLCNLHLRTVSAELSFSGFDGLSLSDIDTYR